MNLEISKEYQELKNTIEALSKEFSILWENRETLTEQVIPELQVKYNLLIQPTIIVYVQKFLELSKLRRKIEILQAALNSKQNVCMKDVEAELEKEFKEWSDRILKMESEILLARQAVFTEIDPNKYRKVQELYRKLVRRLHPDLNKEQTERQKLLWNRVQVAYHEMDYEELISLEILLDSEEVLNENSSIETLQKQKETLWNKITDLNTSIQKLKNTFPLNLKEELNNPNWIKNEQETYLKKIIEIEKILPEYNFIYKDIVFQLYGNIKEHPENL